MEQRDLIEDEIQQLGKFVQNLFSNLLKLKSSKNEFDANTYTSEKLNEKFNLNLNEILLLSDEDFKNFIITNKFNESQIETLSKIFFELYSINKEDSKKYLKKSIESLEFADAISNTYSIKRNNRKLELLNLQN